MSDRVDDRGSFWFKSSLFEIEPGEDAEINPGIYGKQLAQWLAVRLRARGYEPEIIAEDWGRCLMCSHDPFWLWIGCANLQDPDVTDPRVPQKDEIIWHCFVECEVPFWKRIFKRVNTQESRDRLCDDLSSILASEPAIVLVPEP
jgi:hypothetical protein